MTQTGEPEQLPTQPARPVLQVPGPGRFATDDASIVHRTSIECCGLLRSALDADWTGPIPGMDWNVAEAVAHACQAMIWYSMDLRAGTSELSTLDLTVKVDSTPMDLVATLGAAAFVLASTIDCTGPDLVGWHPWGNPDVSGFRAMACDEMLLHTDDAARGLGIPFTPSPDLALHTLERLFPWAPTSGTSDSSGDALADSQMGQRPCRSARPQATLEMAMALRPAVYVGPHRPVPLRLIRGRRALCDPTVPGLNQTALRRPPAELVAC